MRNVWTIARREYNHYFSTPISYAVACAILLIVGLIFALTVFAAYQGAIQGGQFGGGSAPDIKGVSGTFTFMLVLSVPALTMRLISDENRMGTIELLLTAPVQDWELVVGKWLSGFLFILTVLAVTLIFPLILNFFLVSPGIDQGLMISSYLGLIMVSAAFLGIGVGVSSLFTNQIASFFVTLGLFVVLWWMFGFLAQYLPGAAGNVFTYLDMGSRFNSSLNAGVINLSDVVYYLSLTALGLFVGTASVEARRWS
jgi:ABC-2 type transport system permease protein